MILNNNKGAMTIVVLMMLSALFMVMMGVAGVKFLETAKQVARNNEAYNYLLVMEDLTQIVARARSLGRDVDCNARTCPAGSTLHTVLTPGINTTICPGGTNRQQYTLCVPERAGSAGGADALDFCAMVDGKNYCLTGATLNLALQRLDVTNEITDHGRPGPYAAVAGAPTQQTGGPLVPRNNTESWSPNITWSSTNSIFAPTCGAYTAGNLSQYWVGCHFCADPRNECWIMRMCPPDDLGCNPRSEQRFVLYFENNRR